MAQAKIVNITGKSQHADELLLGTLGAWKLARAELRLSWAAFDYQSKFCTNEEAEGCDLGEIGDQFSQMRQAENQMVLSQPCTTVGCQHILEAVVDILQERQRSPDKNLGKGPVIELILNVVRALEQRDVNITLKAPR